MGDLGFHVHFGFVFFVYIETMKCLILTAIISVFDLFGSVDCAIEVLIGVACIVMETVILLIND